MEDNTNQSPMLRYWSAGKTLLFYVLAGKGISFTWKLILGRLGPETLGATEITLTILYTFQAFSLLGLHMPLMRFTTKRVVSNNKGVDEYFFLTLRAVSLLSIPMIVCAYAFPDVVASWFGKTVGIAKESLQYVLVVPLLAASELIWTQWVSRKYVSLYAFGKYTLPPIARLLMILVVIFFGTHAHAAISHVAFAGVMVFLVSVLLSRNIIHKPKNILSSKRVREYIRYSMPVTGSFLLFTVYGASDVLFTSRLLGAKSVGLLSVAVLFADAPNIIATPLLNVFQTYLGGYKTMRDALLFGFANIRRLSIVGLCFILAGFAVFPVFIPALMGAEYASVIRVAQLLLIGTVVETAVILPLRHILDYYGHTSITLVLMAIAAVVKIGTLSIAVPVYGLQGVIYAHWAAIGTHAIGVMVLSFFLQRPRALLSVH